jgi:hypothetical protein
MEAMPLSFMYVFVIDDMIMCWFFLSTRITDDGKFLIKCFVKILSHQYQGKSFKTSFLFHLEGYGIRAVGHFHCLCL